ncbi:peptidoglycan-associated lipoprotein Pal [Pleionea litopenaei]|uniref:Peptidoglycan-associated lipoprotein n=1 Tax=Pleionea litopenaei TaxID=3070815 RepID=A0AA51X803_9GAMM|nr:peptidoglycan-associated lipoprotein Pal [Pleionea sp. HL-JVS1]WMS88867.1 peptidoglycan-associated lipoprotein Pal [Pleionea sp. HL-JVS1]
MSIKGLGKSILVTLPALFLFACSGSDTGTGPETTDTVENQVETTTPQVESAEDKAKRLNEEARKVRTVYFEFDDSTVKSEYQDLLKAHAWFLSRNPGVQIVVEGHCDERGTPEYNLALGERRGNSVRDILMSYGVTSSQIRVVSYGEENPANPAHNEMAWEKNRRAVLNYEG